MNQKTICARLPKMLAAFEELVIGESTRNGGVSLPPFKSLNLSFNTGDEKEKVQENRQRFFDSLGIPIHRVVFNHQVHGDDILIAETPGNYEGFDAIISNKENLFITIGLADCCPLLFYDPIEKVYAGAHAGWRGTVANIGQKVIAAMESEFNCQAKNIHAYIGTCIDECSFEVDSDVADHFTSDFKRWDETKQKFFIDLKQCNKAQLLAKQIPETQIEISPYSTVLNNEDYFSYRKENGNTGRMMAVIGLL